MNTKLSVIAALMLLSIGLGAQTNGSRPEVPQKKTPAEMAKAKADMMLAEVGLDDKQYKKVYKLFKSDFQHRENLASQAFQGGMPPQGGPGMGGPGMGGGMMGGPGMGGGGMMGGMPPQGGFGMGGGRPPQGGSDMGERPEGFPGMGPGNFGVDDEYLEKQDQKLRKILTPDQYDRWSKKHPAELLEMPAPGHQGNPNQPASQGRPSR